MDDGLSDQKFLVSLKSKKHYQLAIASTPSESFICGALCDDLMEELSVKKDFTDVYMQDSPYNYLKTMRDVEYRIPNETKPLYLSIVDQLYSQLKRPLNILDIGSSYGINSALMTFDLTMEDLDAFFLKSDKPPSREESEEFFSKQPKKDKRLNFYQIDISSPALKFSEDVGLCKGSLCVNLETETPKIPNNFVPIDMVIATGCVGYIGYKAFSRLFEFFQQENNGSEMNSMPVFAFSLMRLFPIEKIQKTFEHYDFSLMKSKITPIPQRHFYSEDEKNNTVAILKERGIKTEELEDKGYYYADFYVGNPKTQQKELTTFIKEIEAN